MKRVRVELEDADGYVYVLPSLVYARDYLGISRATMDSVCDRDIRVGGFLVRKSESESEETNEKELPRKVGTERRRIRQEVIAWREGGEAVKFPSFSDAARTAGCREVTIRQALRRGAKAGGWYWEKAEGSRRECRDWYPGMPVAFKFRANAMLNGREVEKKERKSAEDIEQMEWAKVGVSDNEGWHEYLNKCIWEELTPPLADKVTDDYGIF